MKRTASAEWRGTLKDGIGKLSTESGALFGMPYTYRMRFENLAGTNPEELVAAAHAGCFSMALSGELQKAGFSPESIQSKATISFDKGQDGWSVTSVHLGVLARVPGANEAQFKQAAESAKAGCPISRLLNTTINMDAQLVPEEPALPKASGA